MCSAIVTVTQNLVHVDVVVMGGVVDGPKEALQLTESPAMDHQDEGDADGHGRGSLDGVLVPLGIHGGLA